MVEAVDVPSGRGNLALPVCLLSAKKILFPPLSASVCPLISIFFETANSDVNLTHSYESYGLASYAKRLAGLCNA